MSNTSRTNASDSDKMPTRKQIAELFSKWARNDGVVSRNRVCTELLGFPEQDEPSGGPGQAQLLELRFVLEQIEKGNLSREQLQAFLRKSQRQSLSLFGEFKTVTIPATTEPFLTLENFRDVVPGQVSKKVCSLADSFCCRFLLKLEEPRAGLALRCGLLKRSSVDRPIIGELGGEQAVEVSTSAIHWLIMQQANGEDGALLNNGCSNVFYVRDDHAEICAVRVYWSDNAWFVGVYEVGYPYSWLVGHQVFSRS